MDTPTYPIEQENAEIIIENKSSFEAGKARVRYRNCTLVSKLGEHLGLFLSMQQWEKSTLHAKKPVKRQRFFHTRFLSCIFLGKYIETDFGFNQRLYSEVGDKENFGQIIDCDFSKADLHFVRFYGDIGETKLPAWPYFTVFRPKEETGFFERAWPEKLGQVIADSEATAWGNPYLFAYTLHAPSLIKDWGRGIALEDLQSMLSEYDFIKF